MKVLVCGGRDYDGMREVFDVLDAVHAKTEINLVIHGACREEIAGGVSQLRGADRWAEMWAISREVPYFGWPAPFSRLPRAGGPWRNQKMLDRWNPDLIIAFPGGKGTASMISKAKKAGVPIQLATADNNQELGR